MFDKTRSNNLLGKKKRNEKWAKKANERKISLIILDGAFSKVLSRVTILTL